MADSPKFKDQRDRNKVSTQKHELAHLKEKFGITGQAAAAAQRQAGPDRKKVEAFIKGKKQRGEY